VITTNGRSEVVTLGAGFPSSEPTFKLVWLAKNKKGIKISVVGGSFAGGVPTLLLAKGQEVTLADQSDGSRFVLELLRLTNQAPPLPPPSTAKTPTGASAAPAATTTTAPQTTTATPAG
jgi:hypothetical protein